MYLAACKLNRIFFLFIYSSNSTELFSKTTEIFFITSFCFIQRKTLLFLSKRKKMKKRTKKYTNMSSVKMRRSLTSPPTKGMAAI